MIRLFEGDSLDILRATPDGTYTFVVTDPPYGLSAPPDPLEVMRQWLADGDFHKKTRGKGKGFMGAEWDHFVPGPILWREVFRTCKPGAIVLCFAATRTMDWMSLSLRCAGFEILDTIAWLQAQGMAKAGTIDKKIDAQRHDRDQVLGCTAWIRERCVALGLKAADLDRAAGTNGMGGHWTSNASQPYVPTRQQWEKLEPLLGPMPPALEAQRLIIDAREKGPDWEKREVLGKHPNPAGNSKDGVLSNFVATQEDVMLTAAATETSAEWAGWSTQLAPGYEPIIVARRPCEGTAVANVLKHGCGAMNIDACRIGIDPAEREVIDNRSGGHGKGTEHLTFAGQPEGVIWKSAEGGRWPKNVILAPSAAAVLDLQVGERVSRDGPTTGGPMGYGGSTGSLTQRVPRREGNNASRYFWVGPLATADDLAFPGRYVPKVRTSERHAGLPEGMRSTHPTVKPQGLMEYLCRLVGHPKGRGLDPFAGSGSTLRAARTLGLSMDGIERDPAFAEIARHRSGVHDEASTPSAPSPRTGGPAA